jgi:hypothetical protein
MNVKNGWSLFGLLALMVGVVACAAAWAVDGQQPKEEMASPQVAPCYRAVIRSTPEAIGRETDRAPTEGDAISDPALVEILEIRRRLGDDPFRGTIFERTTAATDGSKSEPVTNAKEDVSRAFTDALKTVAAGARETPRSVEPKLDSRVPFLESSPDADFVGALRQAARALDGKAADLEPLRHYGQADQLRRLAAKLRRQARDFDGPSWLD